MINRKVLAATLPVALVLTIIFAPISSAKVASVTARPAPKVLSSEILAAAPPCAPDTPVIGPLCHAFGDLTTTLENMGTTLGTITSALSWDNVKNNILNTIGDFVAKIINMFFRVGYNVMMGIGFTDQDPSGATTSFLPGTLLANTFEGTNQIYPRTTDFLADTFNENIFGSKTTLAFTQTGRNIITSSGIVELWKIMRNIAYLAVTVILVIYGFMVMFRSKIDPRTVATVQAAIPNLAIGLVLISFSLIVPALFVDIARVLEGTTGVIFSQLRTINGQDICSQGNDAQWNRFVNSGIGDAGVPLWVYTSFDCLPLPINYWALANKIGVSNEMLASIGTPSAVIDFARWIIGFALWFAYLQIFLAVIMRVVYLVARTIFGPILIAIGIIPGQTGTIRKWVLATFVDAVSIAGIYFVMNIAMFLWAAGNFSAMPGGVNPLGYPGGKALRVGDIMPGSYGNTYANILWLVSIGTVMLASKVPAFLEEALDIVPGGHSARAGVDIMAAARRMPILGGFVG